MARRRGEATILSVNETYYSSVSQLTRYLYIVLTFIFYVILLGIIRNDIGKMFLSMEVFTIAQRPGYSTADHVVGFMVMKIDSTKLILHKSEFNVL